METTFAVNVLAPHLLTALLAEQLTGRLLWLGSGLVRSGRVQPDALGQERDPATGVRRQQGLRRGAGSGLGSAAAAVASAAVDPGWVRTKLASPGAPGHPRESAETLAYCATEADLTQALYWRDRRPVSVPGPLRDPALADALAAACDRLAGLTG